MLHSCIVLSPVGHSSNHQYHCCQLTRQSSCLSNFYRSFKVFIWLSLIFSYSHLTIFHFRNSVLQFPFSKQSSNVCFTSSSLNVQDIFLYLYVFLFLSTFTPLLATTPLHFLLSSVSIPHTIFYPYRSVLWLYCYRMQIRRQLNNDLWWQRRWKPAMLPDRERPIVMHGWYYEDSLLLEGCHQFNNAPLVFISWCLV